MKHKVSELEGALLNHAVAMAEGDTLPDYWRDPDDGTCWSRPGREEWAPGSRWDQGGPIIERERIDLGPRAGQWTAHCGRGFAIGAAPLIAAMRAYVSSKLGDEVELAMTDERKELIERWARKAISGQDWTGDDAAPYERFEFNEDGLERFAALVRADALEDAAKACEAMPPPYWRDLERGDCADAIRKLIQSPPLGK